MNGFEKFDKKLLSKGKFYSSFTGNKVNDKEFEHVGKVWDSIEIKTMKNYQDLHLKCDVLL